MVLGKTNRNIMEDYPSPRRQLLAYQRKPAVSVLTLGIGRHYEDVSNTSPRKNMLHGCIAISVFTLTLRIMLHESLNFIQYRVKKFLLPVKLNPVLLISRPL